MPESELASAAYWAAFWGRVETWAFAGVVITLAIEFAALKFGAPYKEALEKSKDLEIAQLNKETAQLKKAAAPRSLSASAIEKLKDEPKGHAQILYVRDAPDGFQFSMALFIALHNAGWQIEGPRAIAPVDSVFPDPKIKEFIDGTPTAMLAGGQPNGVSLVIGASSAPDNAMEQQTALGSISRLLFNSLGAVSWAAAPALPKDTIRVVVAPKQ